MDHVNGETMPWRPLQRTADKPCGRLPASRRKTPRLQKLLADEEADQHDAKPRQ
jgi:hypothetical protein